MALLWPEHETCQLFHSAKLMCVLFQIEQPSNWTPKGWVLEVGKKIWVGMK